MKREGEGEGEGRMLGFDIWKEIMRMMISHSQFESLNFTIN